MLDNDALIIRVCEKYMDDPTIDPGIQADLRVAFAQPGSKQPGPDKNELDVAFLYRNTMHIIECKTANLGQTGTGTDSKATEALYKMESLLKLGVPKSRVATIVKSDDARQLAKVLQELLAQD